MKNFPPLLPIFLLISLKINAQGQLPGKYWVEFTDKKDSPFSIFRPTEFLSPRAIVRREKSGIPIEENDLPVVQRYVDSLKTAGARIHHTSRWLNAATVQANEQIANELRRFSFVKKVEYVGKHLSPRHLPNRPLKKRVPFAEVPKIESRGSVFGYATLQNSLLKIPFLHFAGARGEGLWVAVMDGGFTNVDTMPFFDSLAAHNRLFSAWDFVEKDNYVFEGAQHGTSVLSVMASNLPNYFVGTAPEATFFCLKTEDTGGEFPVEETNWVAGAEFADSLGADIINASLGYTTFNDTTLSHNYLHLDGRFSIASRGAKIAASKGMIVCNSAGNSGDEPWRFVGVPADAPGLIAVGASDHDNGKANFSSFGPTADGRIKPDLAAPGEMVVTAGNAGLDLGFSNGTSIASPMLAGSLASLWSAFPEKTAAEILDATFASASQKDDPDNGLGYGIPDFTEAWLRLGGFAAEGHFNDGRELLFSVDRAAGELSFLMFSDVFSEKSDFRLLDQFGHEIRPKSVKVNRQQISKITFSGLEDLPRGSYQAVLIGENSASRHFFLFW